ncbi:MAG: Hsp70 family protein, partial [Actinomycetota bacterium]|nr:Hsp70 family protein [Actinomycetota bacterium]
MLPGVHTQVRLVRSEFEEMIRPAVEETVAALGRALGSAGLDAGGLDAVLLVGGSSRIPLIAQLVSAELGRPVAVDADPKTTTATGAALAARGTEVEETAVQDAPVAAMPSSVAVDQDDVAVTALPARPPKATLRSRDEDEDSRPERSRVRMLTLAAAASVVAMIALAGAVSSGINPLGSNGGTGTGVAAAEAAPLSTDAAMPASGDGVDQWTGRPRAVTTAPGPQRPNARAAVTPPGARTTSPTTNARPAPDGGGGTGATTPRPLVDSGGPSGPGTGVEETSATQPTEEPSATQPTEETSATQPTEEPSATQPTEETSATPRAEEPPAIPTTSATPPAEGPSTPAVPAP